MSADGGWPRPLATAWMLASALACGGGGGGGGGPDSPDVKGIDPAFGYSAAPVSVTITGDNFLARPQGSGLDTKHEAWLDDTPLEGVTWIDSHTLRATVPAGVSAGSKRLKVENAYGRQGSLADAYTVLVPAGLVATIKAGRATADVDQAIPVKLTIVNGAGGGAASAQISAVTPTVEPSGSASCSPVKPTPPQTVAASRSVEFEWSCTAAAAGTLTLGAQVSGAEVVSGNPLSATAATDSVEIQTPAALDASLVIAGISPPATVNVGQALDVTVTVSNSGSGQANIIGVAPAPSPSGRALCDTPNPPLPFKLAGHGSQGFAFTCTPASQGPLSLGTAVAGTNINIGGALDAAAAPALLTVEFPAAPAAAVGALPTTVDVGQTVNVTFAVAAGAGAAGMDGVSVAPSSTGVDATCGTASPASQNVPAGQIRQFGWTCTAHAAGELVLSGTAQGTDANQPTVTVTATPAAGAEVRVQAPASLSVTGFQSPTSVNLDQVADVSLTLVNDGGAAARITSVVPSPTGTPGIGCTAPQPPASPSSPYVLGHGETATFTWSCTGTSAGSYQLGAAVVAADANWPAVNPSPSITPRALAVQRKAALAVTSFTASPGAVGPGTYPNQETTVTLRLRNTGDATADVTSVIPASTPAGLSCGAVTPAASISAPQPIGDGASLDFTWRCSGTPGTYALGADVAGSDANDGAALAASASGAGVTVHSLADLTASLSAVPASANVGQLVSVRLSIANAGSGTAHVSALTWSFGSNMSCGDPSRSAPFDVPAGTTVVTWDCTPHAGPSASLTATLAAADVDTGVDVTPAVPPGTLAIADPALAADPLSIVGTLEAGRLGSVAVSLRLRNVGNATAQVTALTPTAVGSAALACSGPVSPGGTVPILAGASQTFTWSCDYSGSSAGETVTLGALVAATDVLSSADVSPAVAGAPLPLP